MLQGVEQDGNLMKNFPLFAKQASGRPCLSNGNNSPQFQMRNLNRNENELRTKSLEGPIISDFKQFEQGRKCGDSQYQVQRQLNAKMVKGGDNLSKYMQQSTFRLSELISNMQKHSDTTLNNNHFGMIKQQSDGLRASININSQHSAQSTQKALNHINHIFKNTPTHQNHENSTKTALFNQFNYPNKSTLPDDSLNQSINHFMPIQQISNNINTNTNSYQQQQQLQAIQQHSQSNKQLQKQPIFQSSFKQQQQQQQQHQQQLLIQSQNILNLQQFQKKTEDKENSLEFQPHYNNNINNPNVSLNQLSSIQRDAESLKQVDDFELKKILHILDVNSQQGFKIENQNEIFQSNDQNSFQLNSSRTFEPKPIKTYNLSGQSTANNTFQQSYNQSSNSKFKSYMKPTESSRKTSKNSQMRYCNNKNGKVKESCCYK